MIITPILEYFVRAMAQSGKQGLESLYFDRFKE